MTSITKRELNQRTAAALALVTESNDVLVTERGKPRWRVSVVREPDTALSRLEHQGRYARPSVDPAPWTSSSDGPAYTSSEVDALLDELHGQH